LDGFDSRQLIPQGASMDAKGTTRQPSTPEFRAHEFYCHVLGNAKPTSLDAKIAAAMKSVWEATAQNHGHWDLYQRAENVAGYDQAIGSALKAANKLFQAEGLVFDAPLNFDDSDVEEQSLFLFCIRFGLPDALKDFAPLVGRAAARGDVDFFHRMQRAEHNGKRRKTSGDPLNANLLVHWIGSCLWLASDATGATYLQKTLSRIISEATYERVRRRMELRSYVTNHTAPIIARVTTAGKFTLTQSGRTTLATVLPGCQNTHR
jgi:hypothetical protein